MRAPPLVLLALSACTADTVGLELRGRDAGPATSADARPDSSPDGSAPDADPPSTCAADRPPITLPARGPGALDLSPDGERVLFADGDQMMLADTRTGALLARTPGFGGGFSQGAQAVVLGAGNQLLLLDDDSVAHPLVPGPVCTWNLSPDRRFAIALTDCRSSGVAVLTVGTLNVIDLAARSVVFFAPDVLAGPWAGTPRGVEPARLAFLFAPAAVACGCQEWDAILLEVVLGERAAHAHGRYSDLLGYAPQTGNLLAGGRACSCPQMEGLTWRDARSDRTVAQDTLPPVWRHLPLDGPGLWSHALPPTQLGAAGMLAVGLDSFRLVYAPYDGQPAPQPVIDPALASAAALLGEGSADIAALTTDGSGRLVRAPLDGQGMVEPLTSPGLAVSDVFVSEDRRRAAAVVSAISQSDHTELWLGTARGPFELAGAWTGTIDALGFLPAGRGFLVREGDRRIRRWSGAWVDVETESSLGTPVVTDAGGCRLAHWVPGGVRVGPIP